MRKVLYIIIFIISLFIINNLVRSIYNLWQKHDLISDAQSQLVQERNENAKLKDQLSRVKRVDFVEEEARNKLFMVKPGEKVVLIGDEKKQGNPQDTKTRVAIVPPWKQWWNLFSK